MASLLAKENCSRIALMMQSGPDATSMTLSQLQHRIQSLYGDKDSRRGIEGTFMWFMEEVGELSAALRSGTHEERMLEFADTLAWLVTLANCAGVDLNQAIARKYGMGCPGCGRTPCTCDSNYKP